MKERQSPGLRAAMATSVGLVVAMAPSSTGLGTAAVVLLGTQPAAAAEADTPDESTYLSRVRRLIFEGRRSGEGYFSPDGRYMVFQSERLAENPFYQIYLLDLETGETETVSNGTGKTTCAFIRPGSQQILFGSTHHDPESQRLQKEELEFRASGQERRYAWDYDPEMDLYAVDRETGAEVRLTNARGYDAEASYSPDGEWIVFSSMRDGYERELSAEEKKTLEIDPAYFGEIYIMRADGSEQKRLTEVPGYDGGPFFFPDGNRIIWRRFSEDGLVADIWSMKTDGSDQKRLTSFGAMSWAPYVHPSGEYVMFASNKLGFTNFEVFVVDTEGTKEPVQITTTDGFDGLPVPTPDGKQLVWTSSRHQGDGGQLYIANWNHEKVLEALEQAPPRAQP